MRRKWALTFGASITLGFVFLSLVQAEKAKRSAPRTVTLRSPMGCRSEKTRRYRGELDTLQYDDETDALYYVFTIPDEYGDDLFNVRFTPTDPCFIREAHFCFSDSYSTGSPDLKVYIWNDVGGFPGVKLDSVVVPGDSIRYYPNWEVIDLSGHAVSIAPAADFHIGYTIANESPGDTVAIFSDDGLPVGSEHRSSEWWDGIWGTMYEDWGLDVNFFIRAVVEYDSIAPPVIEIDPTHTRVVIPPDSTVEANLRIRNTGGSDLRFSIVPSGLSSPEQISKRTEAKKIERSVLRKLRDALSIEEGTSQFPSHVELFYDDGTPHYFFNIPDVYGDDLFNVRFTPAFACTLKRAEFRFHAEPSWEMPDLRVYIWDDENGFPGEKIDSVDASGSAIITDDWLIFDLTTRNITFDPGVDFHIGYTVINESVGDTLGILSDDGLPVGSEHRSSELWEGEWGTMFEDWGLDVNFMIRAVVRYYGWLLFDPVSGFVRPSNEMDIRLIFDATGLADTTVTADLVIENNSVAGPVVFPCTLVVSSNFVEEEEGPSPRRYGLGRNFPNPFNASTVIPYHLPTQRSALVILGVYNILGEKVRTLVNGPQTPGEHRVSWDGRDDRGCVVASGIYLYRLKVGSITAIGKAVLLR